MKKLQLTRSKWKEYGFLFSILAFPLAQFLVFYVGVNFNSIILSLKTYNTDTLSYEFLGFDNFIDFFSDIFVDKDYTLLTSMKNSGILFLLTNFIGLPLNIIIAYFIWKKVPFAGFFKVVVFLPSMISSIVFVLIMRFFLDYVIPVLIGNPDMPSLLLNADASFYTIVIYGLWIGLASGLVVFLGAMSGIDDELMEYSRFEGVGAFKEFTTIVIPMIFPTVITYIIAAIAGYFTNQSYFYAFYSTSLESRDYTLGYYFFVMVVRSNSYADFPYASAAGLVFTIVLVPITLTVKYLLEKYGPRTD